MGKQIFAFHVQLKEITPAIWRRLEVRAEGTFWHLHCAIQDAMPWEDRHLHEFRFATGDERVRIGFPEFDPFPEEEGVLASWMTALSDWFVAPASFCTYEYDFGDSWEHTVILESVHAAEVRGRYPRCTGGERACPPEDVGGSTGYARFLEAMADRRHSEHREYRDWIGGSWDPEGFRAGDVVFSQPAARLRRALA
jgi:Plasmid pRiA4b ORF-3-like protein